MAFIVTVAAFLRSYRFQFIAVVLSLAVLYSAIVPSMVQWWYQDDNYSHGFIVPLIAGYFLYCRREELLNATVEPWWPGLLVLLAGLFQLLAGWLVGVGILYHAFLAYHGNCRDSTVPVGSSSVSDFAAAGGLSPVHGSYPLHRV